MVIRDSLAFLLDDSHLGVRHEAITGLAKMQDKRVARVLIDELSKDEVYDDFVQAAGFLGDETLLLIPNNMMDRFESFEILDKAISLLKKDINQ